MSRNAGVLTMTDLRPDSEQALVLAGRIAERCGLRMDVLYALGLRGLSLRDAVPTLHDLDQRIATVVRSVRSLVRAHFPHWEQVPGPVIDVDNGPVALTRRAAQLQPPIIVLPSRWHDAQDADWSRGLAAIATISMPVLLVSRTGASCCERAVLLTMAATSTHTFVPFTHEWVRWFQAVGSGSTISDEPSIAVVAIEDSSRLQAIAAVTMHERPLVVIPKAALEGPKGGVMRTAVASFLTRQSSHVLITPDVVPPPLRPECQTDLSLVVADA